MVAGFVVLQMVTPDLWQTPCPSVQTVPLSAKVSSVAPSQSLSSASHVSVPPEPAVTLHTVAVVALAGLHTSSPVLRHTPDPAVQMLPLFDHRAPSSVAASQSSSRPLQTSVVPVPARALHTVAPAGFAALHCFVPDAWQAPVPVVQTLPLSAQALGSSVAASQSLSSPSQVSVPAAPATALQTSAPAGAAASQTFTPATWHTPTPAVQAWPFVTQSAPSSICPSQSLSSPSQVSVPGLPAATLHTVAPAGDAALQTVIPALWQTPSPAVQGVPLFTQSAPSSVAPSQLLSSPSHTSVPAVPCVAPHTVAPAGFAALHCLVPVF